MEPSKGSTAKTAENSPGTIGEGGEMYPWADTPGPQGFFSDSFSKILGRQVQVVIDFIDYASIDEVSPAYQKKVQDSLVEDISKHFNSVAMGFLVVNIRENRKVALVDGRHRKLGSERIGYKGVVVIGNGRVDSRGRGQDLPGLPEKTINNSTGTFTWNDRRGDPGGNPTSRGGA